MKIDGKTEGDRIDEPDITTLLVVNHIIICYEGETHMRNDSEMKVALLTT